MYGHSEMLHIAVFDFGKPITDHLPPRAPNVRACEPRLAATDSNIRATALGYRCTLQRGPT